MRAPTYLAALCLALAVSGCSSDDGNDADARETATPTATPTDSAAADPCALAPGVNSVPESCISEAPATPTGPPLPGGSSAYAPLKLAPEPGQLKATGNDVDVNKVSDTFSVTVRAGYKLGVHAVCEGRTEVKITAVPDSGAALAFACGFEGFPAEIGAADPTSVDTATTYQVKVSVPAPSRWFLNFYETNQAAPVPPV